MKNKMVIIEENRELQTKAPPTPEADRFPAPVYKLRGVMLA